MTTIIERVTPFVLHRQWKNTRNVTYWKRERDPRTKDSLNHHPRSTFPMPSWFPHNNVGDKTEIEDMVLIPTQLSTG